MNSFYYRKHCSKGPLISETVTRQSWGGSYQATAHKALAHYLQEQSQMPEAFVLSVEWKLIGAHSKQMLNVNLKTAVL